MPYVKRAREFYSVKKSSNNAKYAWQLNPPHHLARSIPPKEIAPALPKPNHSVNILSFKKLLIFAINLDFSIFLPFISMVWWV